MGRKYTDGELFTSIIYTLFITIVALALRNFVGIDYYTISFISFAFIIIVYLILERKFKLSSLKIFNDNPIARYYSGHRFCVNLLNTGIIFLFFESVYEGKIITERI